MILKAKHRRGGRSTEDADQRDGRSREEDGTGEHEDQGRDAENQRRDMDVLEMAGEVDEFSQKPVGIHGDTGDLAQL